MVLTEAFQRAGKRKATELAADGHNAVLRAAAVGVGKRVEDKSNVMLHERAGGGIERAGDLLRAAGDAEHAEAGHRQQHDGRQQTGHTAPERVTRADAHGLFLRRSGDFGSIGFARP